MIIWSVLYLITHFPPLFSVCSIIQNIIISLSLFFFIDSSTLPAELQRLLNTIRELDERSQGTSDSPLPVFDSSSFSYNIRLPAPLRFRFFFLIFDE